jgi:hypothetical protein
MRTIASFIFISLDGFYEGPKASSAALESGSVVGAFAKCA